MARPARQVSHETGGTNIPPRPVRPLTEGYERRGGQIQEPDMERPRPAPPAAFAADGAALAAILKPAIIAPRPAPPAPKPVTNVFRLLADAADISSRPGPTYTSGARLQTAQTRMQELMCVLPDAIEASTGELNAGLKVLRDLLF